MFNPNDYLGREYPNPPCWALVMDVFRSECNVTVLDFKTVNDSIREISKAFRLALHKGAHGFSQISVPTDLCLVLLGVRTDLHHCGIFWQGHVLHALPAGVLLQDMASLRDEYRKAEYWWRPEIAT